MNHNIKGTEVSITPELRSYVEKKLLQAEKFTNGDSTTHVDVELEYSQVRDSNKYRAEFTLSRGAEVYRAEEWGESLHGAIDGAANVLEKELRRTKRKRLHLVRHSAAKVKDYLRGFRRNV